jgi:uncharacterized protein (TIGR00255 family)
MTGFGRGTCTSADGAVAVVEIRSVNNRFLDVSVKGGREAVLVEPLIRERLRTRLERGKVSVSVAMQRPGEELPEPDLGRAAAYLQALRSLKAELGLDGEPDLAMMAGFRDVLMERAVDADEGALWGEIAPAVDQALEAVVEMRRREGEALSADLTARVEAIEEKLGGVEERAPERAAEYLARMKERLRDLLEGVDLDHDRMNLELSLYADRIDISEECTRLHSHIDQAREAIDAAEPAGRRLNFLLQEMHREVNTLGSKANDAQIGYLVVGMKEELEKIREQVQNIE